MTLIRDNNNEVIQAFVTNDIVAVTLSVEWTPPITTMAFRVPTACTYTLDGNANPASLQAGVIVWISSGRKYTFDTTMNVELM